jgi:ABC-type lipoprotein release transport system permease subunit
MSASAIRDLARRHAVGELSLEDYRSKRHELIDDIVSGRQLLTYGEHRPPRPPSARSSSRLILFAGAAIGVIVIITLTILLAGTHSHVVSTARQSHPPSQQDTAQISPGPLLVENFVHSSDWSTLSIQNFIRQWNSLPQKEREIAKKDYRYPRLISELHQQIIAQQAMSGLTKNTDAAKAQLANLQNMATILGVESDN